MICRLGMFADEGIQFVIVLNIGPRAYLSTTIWIQCRLRDNLAGDADSIAELMPILFARHVIEQDTWMLARIFRFYLNAATAW